MTKAYIELAYKRRKYKVNSEDIGKLYRINKRKIPALPAYNQINKQQSDTDDDVEINVTITQ
jgi:hypothetical protein